MKAYKFLPVFLIVGSFFSINPGVDELNFMRPVYAETKTYTGTGEHIMTNSETPDKAKENARSNALKNIRAQVGIFVSSMVKVEKHVVEKDTVETFTAGILKIVSAKYKAVPVDEEGSQIKYTATVTANINGDELEKRVNDWLAGKNRQTGVLLEKIDDQAKKISELENIIISSQKSEPDKKKIAEVEKKSSYMKLYRKAKLERTRGDYFKAINYLDEALRLNPDFAKGYFLRGQMHEKLKDFNRAVEDYETAADKDKKFDKAYYECGKICHKILRDNVRATQYFTKAIEINPADSYTYFRRGLSYHEMKIYDKALADYTESIRLNQYQAAAYYHRSDIYRILGEKDKANADEGKYQALRNMKWRGLLVSREEY